MIRRICLLVLFLVSVSICLPQIPTRFIAETMVVTQLDGVIDTEQHDYIWVDVPEDKMKTVTVDEIFGTNNTLIYRGDLKKEFYIKNDLECFFGYAPEHMQIKLIIKENSSLVDTPIINGIKYQLWVYSAINEKISYYIRDTDFAPLKIELTSGKYINTINFIKFDPITPPSSVFEINNRLHCEQIRLHGLALTSRNDIRKYFDATPVFNLPQEQDFVLEGSVASQIDPATLTLIGKTIWAIIKENQAEANLEANTNAVIPKGATWTDMSGWRQQKWPGWQWTLVNAYGATVVDYKWSFNFLCNGNYKDIGKYIENAAAFPTSINVLWGYKVNVKGQVLNPFNYGSTSSPVAGITLSMTMDSTTLVKKITQNCLVNLIGDCTAQLVSCNGYKESMYFSYID